MEVAVIGARAGFLAQVKDSAEEDDGIRDFLAASG